MHGFHTSRCRSNSFGVRRAIIENKGSGISLIDDLRQGGAAGMPMPIAFDPENDKVTRMATQSAKIESSQMFLPRKATWLDDFRTELLQFPNGRYDDQVDSLSQFLHQRDQGGDEQTLRTRYVRKAQQSSSSSINPRRALSNPRRAPSSASVRLYAFSWSSSASASFRSAVSKRRRPLVCNSTGIVRTDFLVGRSDAPHAEHERRRLVIFHVRF